MSSISDAVLYLLDTRHWQICYDVDADVYSAVDKENSVVETFADYDEILAYVARLKILETEEDNHV